MYEGIYKLRIFIKNVYVSKIIKRYFTYIIKIKYKSLFSIWSLLKINLNFLFSQLIRLKINPVTIILRICRCILQLHYNCDSRIAFIFVERRRIL